MYRRSTLSLVIWLALFGWLISACGPAQAPPTGEASQPTSAEEHEVCLLYTSDAADECPAV